MYRPVVFHQCSNKVKNMSQKRIIISARPKPRLYKNFLKKLPQKFRLLWSKALRVITNLASYITISVSKNHKILLKFLSNNKKLNQSNTLSKVKEEPKYYLQMRTCKIIILKKMKTSHINLIQTSSKCQQWIRQKGWSKD